MCCVAKGECQRCESLLSVALSMTSVAHHTNGLSFSLALSYSSECHDVLISAEQFSSSVVTPEMMLCLLGGVVSLVLLVGSGQLNFCYMFI